MPLEKQTIVDQIEVTKSGAVQVRMVTGIVEDGKVLSSSLHRHVVAPGDDYSAEDARVQAICAATHTADVVAAYEAAQASLAPSSKSVA
jgi:hypothetical protein